LVRPDKALDFVYNIADIGNWDMEIILTTQRFKTTISKSGSRTFIAIPFNPNDVWGVKQRHYVTGLVNACKVRGSLGSDGKQYFLPLGAAWLRDNDVGTGTNVDVVLSPEGPQLERLPADVTRALDAEPRAKAFFEGLATFYRNTYTKWIEGAKRPETREARIAEMVKLLKAGKKQK
jgi:Bacteriocin-protection, YdeI or OmpD-Associated/Domain of unknown function (DUF1905)